MEFTAFSEVPKIALIRMIRGCCFVNRTAGRTMMPFSKTKKTFRLSGVWGQPRTRDIRAATRTHGHRCRRHCLSASHQRLSGEREQQRQEKRQASSGRSGPRRDSRRHCGKCWDGSSHRRNCRRGRVRSPEGQRGHGPKRDVARVPSAATCVPAVPIVIAADSRVQLKRKFRFLLQVLTPKPSKYSTSAFAGSPRGRPGSPASS